MVQQVHVPAIPGIGLVAQEQPHDQHQQVLHPLSALEIQAVGEVMIDLSNEGQKKRIDRQAHPPPNVAADVEQTRGHDDPRTPQEHPQANGILIPEERVPIAEISICFLDRPRNGCRPFLVGDPGDHWRRFNPNAHRGLWHCLSPLGVLPRGQHDNVFCPPQFFRSSKSTKDDYNSSILINDLDGQQPTHDGCVR